MKMAKMYREEPYTVYAVQYKNGSLDVPVGEFGRVDVLREHGYRWSLSGASPYQWAYIQHGKDPVIFDSYYEGRRYIKNL